MLAYVEFNIVTLLLMGSGFTVEFKSELLFSVSFTEIFDIRVSIWAIDELVNPVKVVLLTTEDILPICEFIGKIYGNVEVLFATSMMLVVICTLEVII